MLLQLSGVPGTGKSTLARGLARERGLVVLDSDVVKSALLTAEVPTADAGRATYDVVLALAADLLAQGRDVVIDSPCRYPALLARGRAVAEEAATAYGFLELRTDDMGLLLQRLDSRTPRPSQVSATAPVRGTAWEHGDAAATLTAWQQQLVRPESGWLALDAAAPREEVLRAALAHVDGLRLSAPGSR